MAPKKHARVLIAGASIAGLTLAIMLERNGIDFLVLEKYDRIAPDLGASICIFPNGFRILDQIGIHGAIMKLVEGADAFSSMCTRDDKGKLISSIQDFSRHSIKRVGYTPIFVERQMIVQILYDNIKEKSRVVTRKSVEHVEHISGGVRAMTRDGDVFTGEILIGADGIHSKVRSEMWRIGNSEKPGYFPLKMRDEVPTEYVCIFGISKPTDKFPRLSSQTVQGNNSSYLLSTGPGGRIYWFLFKKLEKIHYGLYDKIPRYTDAERDLLAKEHANDLLVDSTGLRFKDLYENRTTATLQALPEVAFSKWYYGRIFTIGDAVHKFNPIGGQGGNSAIEDAAVLTNHLYKLIGSEKNNTSNLTDANIKAAFASTQAQRFDRAAHLKKISHDMNSVQAKDKFVSKLIAKYVIPRAGTEQVFSMLSVQSLGAAKLEMFDVPERPHSDFWFDERPAKPFTDGAAKLGRLIASVVFGLYIGWLALAMQRPDPSIPLPETFLGLEPRTHFTGNQAIDAVFKMASLTFANTVGWVDVGHSLQGLNLLFLLAPLFLVWYIEAYRHGSKGSFIAWATLWGFVIHPLSVAIAAPLYFLTSIWSFSSDIYTSGVGRHIPSSIARSILPALSLGCIVPTALVFVPFVPKTYLPELILMWALASVSVGILIHAFSAVFSAHEKNIPAGTFDPYLYDSRELPHLNRAYKAVFAFSLLYHVPIVLVCLSSPKLNFARLFLPGVNLEQFPDSHEAAMFVFLKWDFLGVFWAIVLFGLYTAWYLRSKGLVTTRQAVGAAVTFLVAQPLAGPGAALVGLWWWREGKIWGEAAEKGVEQVKG